MLGSEAVVDRNDGRPGLGGKPAAHRIVRVETAGDPPSPMNENHQRPGAFWVIYAHGDVAGVAADLAKYARHRRQAEAFGSEPRPLLQLAARLSEIENLIVRPVVHPPFDECHLSRQIGSD